VIDPLNRGKEYTYDDVHRISRDAEVTYDPESNTYTETGPANDYTYDGLEVTATNALDETKIYTYDRLYRLETVEVVNDTATETTWFLYDDAGNLTDLQDGNPATWVYDNLNRVTTETIDGNDAAYEYDAVGNVIEKTDRNGNTTNYEYDNLYRLTAEKWYDGTTLLRTIDYEFDAAGNLTSVSDPDATIDTTYDGLNRIRSVEQSITGGGPPVLHDREYDAASRLTASIATIGSTADYVNDYIYDALGRLTRVTQIDDTENAVNPKRVDFTYNAADQLTSILRYASTTTGSPVAATEFSYDELGRAILIDHNGTASGSTFTETHGYDYDDANRVIEYTNDIDSVSAVYDYDKRGQLIEANHVSTTYDEAYTYDDDGNREMVDNFAGTDQDYVIQDYNQIDTDSVYLYVYDLEGNVIKRTNATTYNSTVYEWDHRNRLISVTDYDGYGTATTSDDFVVQQVDYTYDAFNQLVKRVVDPDGDVGSAAIRQTVYVHDQGQVVLQLDKSGTGSLTSSNLSHRYLWGPAVDQLMADEQVDWGDSDSDGPVYWPLTDRQGSVTDVVDSNGDLRIHRRFDSFGNIVNETHYNTSGSTVTSGQTGYVDEAFAYTGRLFDGYTDLQNNLHRWYDPRVGRWMSEDPIGFAASDSNLYRYVENEPTGFVDPLGLWNEWGGGAPPPGGPRPPGQSKPTAGGPSFLDLYWYYLTHPGAQDEDIQTAQNVAVTISVLCFAAAGGLALGGAANLTELGTVPLSQVPRQAVIEYWTWGMGSAAATSTAATRPQVQQTTTIWPPPSMPPIWGPIHGGDGASTPLPWTFPPYPFPIWPGVN
jgi:RHS repeat-associated protein